MLREKKKKSFLQGNLTLIWNFNFVAFMGLKGEVWYIKKIIYQNFWIRNEKKVHNYISMELK